MPLPSVAIGIPTYNRPKLTRRAVQSVLAQNYVGPIGVVVVDDGSDPPLSIDWVAGAVSDQRSVVLIRNEGNRGIACAKNRALLGVADLRGILDSDDELHPGFVSRCVAALQAHPDVDVVYTDDQIVYPGRTPIPQPAAEWDDGAALLTCRMRGDTWLARWTALKRCGLHDERFELDVDYELFMALWSTGAAFLRIPETLVTVHRLDESASKNRMKAAYWHAACLGKYGHSKQWALDRAVRNPEWLPAIEDGYAFGRTLAPR